MGSDWCLCSGVANFGEGLALVAGSGLLTVESGGEVGIFCWGIMRAEYAVGRSMGAGSNLDRDRSSRGDDEVDIGSNSLFGPCMDI